MLKKGNSNVDERIDLIERFIHLVGQKCTGALVADREFISDKWLQYLEQQHILYSIKKNNM